MGLRACPTPSGLAGRVVSQFGRPEGWFGWLAGWVMALRPSNRQRNVWAVSLLEVGPRHDVLEIGFGPGLALAEAARRTTGRVVGIDHSPVMVAMARRRVPGRVELRLGSAEGLGGVRGPFDRALAVNSLQFWPDPVGTLRAVRGLMAAGGRMAVVFQPRWRGATDADTDAAAREIAGALAEAGFRNARIETLKLEPVAAACVLADA